MQLKIHPFRLQLKNTFRISHTSRDAQDTVVVELSDGNYSGFGEATATSYYGLTQQGMIERLEALSTIIENSKWDTPENWWKFMQAHLEDQTFIQCALDVAAHDLYGKKIGKPLYKIWELNTKQVPISNYTIGISSIEDMVDKMKAQPWPIYKIKLGTNKDIEIIETLRQHTDSILRVDANCAWTAEQTIEYAPKLKALGVEFIEQPLPKEDFEGMKKVFAASVLPVIADESCQTEADVIKCFQHFHGINIKLMKCGGITPAKRMIAEAKKLGMKVMIGCMTESTVGISAIGQLLPLLDYVDMDGPLLVKNDIATGVYLKDGQVFFPNENGTGAKLIT